MRFSPWMLLGMLLITGFTAEYPVSYPTNYFRAPIGQPLRLSGTFGELRPNHFHSGIDIKGAIGQSLYAAADGYISRIRVQKDGYGKVIYLAHPNGYTTVYAHMNNFTSELEEYIKQVQYQKKEFEVELFPKEGQFAFKKGDKIGAMGTTGSSFGPHLHFEIRDSRTSKPINPLLFGLPFQDNDPPKMHQLRVYGLNDKLETRYAQNYDLTWKDGKYTVGDGNLTIGAWRAGFALKVYDHMNSGANYNGIYSLKMYVDEELTYDFDMETFSFNETRYLNAHLDYEERQTNRAYFNRCYSLPGNRLSIYKRQANQGVVPLYEEKKTKITMVAYDAAGNSSRLEFFVKRGAINDRTASRSFNYVLPYDQENIIDNYSIYLRFPEGCFYENVYMNYSSSAEQSENIYSAVHTVHDDKTPVHRYFDIAIRPTLMPDHLKEKAFIALCDDNRVYNYGGTWKGGLLRTRVRSLGDYCIMVDETPPTIKPVAFSENMKGYNRMIFEIGDNFPSSGRAKGLTYRATVDGEWILMEYDEKNDLIFHRFDGRIGPGKHQLKIVLIDSEYNTTVFERGFVR